MENTLTLLRINDFLVLVGFFLFIWYLMLQNYFSIIVPAVYAWIIPYLQYGKDNGFVRYYNLFCEARMIFKVHDAILSLLCGLPFYCLFTVWWWHLRVWGLFEDTDGLPASIYSHISNIYPSSGASELPETFSIRHQLYGPHVLWTILYFNWFDCWIYILFNLCADCGSLFSLFSLLIRIELLVNVFMKKLDRIEHKDNKS